MPHADKLLLGIAIIILVSCRNDHYSMNDFDSVKKIDTHIHLNSENPALDELAKTDNFILLDVNVDVPDYPDMKEQRRLGLLHATQHPDQVKFLAAFTMANWNSLAWTRNSIEELRDVFGHGALGIKVWKNIGMVEKDTSGNFIMIDNPRFDSVINFVIQQDKTVMGHLGEPKNCWLPVEQMTVNNDRSYFKNHPEYHMFLHPEYPSYEDQINARDRFLERHPDMRFVGAHLGSLEWSVDELAKRLDKFPNMAVDMAQRICHLQYQTIQDREKVRNFMIKYQDRLIYATDSDISNEGDPEQTKKGVHETWLEDWKYFVTEDAMTVDEVNGSFKGLDLPKEVIDKIYYKNAVRWFRIVP